MSRRAPCATVAAAALALMLLPGIARAQSAQSVLYACINPGNGVVRVVAENEACRSTETRLQWNVVGQQGPEGPRGEQGPQGAQGPTGDRGATGEKGETGTSGQKGDKGDTGAPGEKGDKGDTGAPGEKGDKGDTGAPGENGAKGDTGAPGEKGDKGDTGAPGENGTPGHDGAPGETGATGLSGFVTTVGYEVLAGSAITPVQSNLTNCATPIAGYKAGANEMAIIEMGLQGNSSVTNNLFLMPQFTENGGAPRNAAMFSTNQAVGPMGYGSVHTVASMPLTKDVTYRFMTAARVQLSAPVTEVICRAVVVIAKLPTP